MTDDRSDQMVQVVQAGRVPRYLYTVADAEHSTRLVLAGAATYNAKKANSIVRQTASLLDGGRDLPDAVEVEVEDEVTATVALRGVHLSWVDLLIPSQRRGDYVQIVPVDQPTVDVPEMDVPYDGPSAGPWKWLTEPWEFEAPITSKVATNMAALRGATITEAARWEDDYFEAFAGSGPDTPRDEVRFIAFPTLVGADGSLAAVASLPVGSSIRRATLESDWTPWDSE